MRSPESSLSASERSQPIGTIVVATCNRVERAAATVRRLLALIDGWPVIVVDDASTDRTAELLHSRFGERVNVIRLDRNRGAAARNAGVKAATTELVAFADDDSWWAPESLCRAAQLFRDDARLGLLAATVLVEPEGRPDPIVDAVAASPLAATPSGPSVLGFLACGAVVRRRAFLEAGGFNPLLHIGAEEELLALDLRAAGWHLAYADRLVAHHAPDPDDYGRHDRVARTARNALLVRWMRRPLPVACRATWMLGRQAVHDPVKRRALRDFLMRLPSALRQRRQVPGDVEADAARLEQ